MSKYLGAANDGLFNIGDALDFKKQIDQKITDIKNTWQTRAGLFLQQKERIAKVQRYAEGARSMDSTKFDPLIERSKSLMSIQLTLETDGIGVITTVTNLQKSEIYNKISTAASGGNLLDLTYWIGQGAKLVDDVGNLVSNFQTINNDMAKHIEDVNALVRDAGAAGFIGDAVDWNVWGPIAIGGGLVVLALMMQRSR